jgi:hypothetical protein
MASNFEGSSNQMGIALRQEGSAWSTTKRRYADLPTEEKGLSQSRCRSQIARVREQLRVPNLAWI